MSDYRPTCALDRNEDALFYSDMCDYSRRVSAPKEKAIALVKKMIRDQASKGLYYLDIPIYWAEFGDQEWWPVANYFASLGFKVRTPVMKDSSNFRISWGAS